MSWWVSQHMPTEWLKVWGDGASDGVPEGLGTSTANARRTQVRGPREEVKPLLLHDLVYMVEYMVLHVCSSSCI